MVFGTAEVATVARPNRALDQMLVRELDALVNRKVAGESISSNALASLGRHVAWIQWHRINRLPAIPDVGRRRATRIILAAAEIAAELAAGEGDEQ